MAKTKESASPELDYINSEIDGKKLQGEKERIPWLGDPMYKQVWSTERKVGLDELNLGENVVRVASPQKIKKIEVTNPATSFSQVTTISTVTVDLK